MTLFRALCKVNYGYTALISIQHINQEETDMIMTIRRSVCAIAAIGTLIGVPMLSGLAGAAENKHVGEAVEHAKEAVEHGKQGHADVLVKHAEGALKHAEAAGMKNPHLDEGVKHLKEAIEHGKAGHADVATKHAEGAVTHLSEVK